MGIIAVVEGILAEIVAVQVSGLRMVLWIGKLDEYQLRLLLAVFESAWILWFLVDENRKAYLKETVSKSFSWCGWAAEREEEREEGKWE